MKKIKFTAIILCVCLLLQIFRVNEVRETKAAVYQLSMAEYYQQVMVEGKKGIDVAGRVIISGWQDYLMLRECLTNKDATAYVNFVQEGNIKASEATFSYNENADKIAIYQDGKVVGAIGRDKTIYNDLSSNSQMSLYSIGLDKACIGNNYGNKKFYGTYDGGGYSIEGVIFDSASLMDSGLFGWIENSGAVQNVNVKNSCMMYSYSVISGYSYGRIENINVENTVSFGTEFGGIVGRNDGTVKNCRVSGCEFMSGSLSRDKNGGIGGIVSQMILGTATSCEVSDTILRGFEDTEAVIGGIVAKQESNTPLYGGISCIDCVSDAILVGGYSMGGICGIMEDDWTVSYINAAYLKNCVFKGTIYEKGLEVSYAGGIIGKVRRDSEIYIVGCTNQGDIYRLGKMPRYSGAIGGIIGESTGDAVLFTCKNKGRLLDGEQETARNGQVTYIGGLAGEANRQLRIINCSSEGEISMGQSHSSDRIGGLVGKMSDNTMQYVANSRNCGNLAGYYTAGLAAVVEKGNNIRNTGIKIENCVNFGRLQGVEVSGLVGEITSGGLLRCYTSYAGQLVLNNMGAEITESYSLAESQVQGMAEVLSEGAKNMANMTIYGYMEKYDYATWRIDENNYPEPQFEITYSYPELTTLETGADTSANRVDNTEQVTSPTPAPSLSPTPNVSSNPSPVTPTSNPGNSDGEKVVVKSVQQFKVKEKTTKKVVLKWKKNSSAKSYVLYRSTKKTSGFKEIAEIKGREANYTDKKVKKGNTYYYQITACYTKQNKKVYSKYSLLKVKVPYLSEPVITLSKDSLDNGTRYMQINLKKTDGQYIEVYIRQEGKAFVKVKLDNEKISKYKNKIRFSYSKGKRTYMCKVRTYVYVRGKRQYSEFSKIKKIKL